MLLPYLTRNVWLLCLAQIFAFTGTNVTIFLGGIIGAQLAPVPILSTLPVAFMIIGVTCGTIPATFFASIYGRRIGFIGAAFFACGMCLVGAWSIILNSFWVYCLACFGMGISVAFVHQYRFAAAESVATKYAPQAISAILLAGIAGAFLGPNMANLTKDLLPETTFVGSYLALAIMVLLPALILYWLKDYQPTKPSHLTPGRALKTLARQPNFILAIMASGVSYAVMSFLMTATPISMHIMDGHSLHHTGIVIQWHIVGMFLPSLFTGKLINRFGHYNIMLYGVAALCTCILVSQYDQSVIGYWIGLVLLGMGWNFLFVAGTALLITCYRENEKYRAQAVNEFLVFGLQATASLSAGWLLSLTSWQAINLMCIPLAMMLIITILWARRQPLR